MATYNVTGAVAGIPLGKKMQTVEVVLDFTSTNLATLQQTTSTFLVLLLHSTVKSVVLQLCVIWVIPEQAHHSPKQSWGQGNLPP